jgi:hypothetical protein
MYTIETKITKENFAQRIDSKVIKEYFTTKAKYNELFKNKVDTAKHVEELLKEITLEMNSAIDLAKETNYTLQQL